MSMEGHELLGKTNKVKAPADFEARVFARLGEAKAARMRRKAAFRYAFAGSAAVVLVGIVLLNVFVLNHTSSRTLAGKGKSDALANQLSFSDRLRYGGTQTYLPVLETVDYSNEYRNVSNQPRTVYILEQVSEVRPTEIKY
jgi:hypothetical protein